MKTALVNEPTTDVTKLTSGLRWVSVEQDGVEFFSSYYTEAKDKRKAAKVARKLLAAKLGAEI
jgi:hypothetical protein